MFAKQMFCVNFDIDYYITVNKKPQYGKTPEQIKQLPVDQIYNWTNYGVPGIAQELRRNAFDDKQGDVIKNLYIPTKEELQKHQDKITPSGLLTCNYTQNKYGERDSHWLITMPNDGDCYYIVKDNLDKKAPQQIDLVQVEDGGANYGVIKTKVGAKPVLVLDTTKLDGYFAETNI